MVNELLEKCRAILCLDIPEKDAVEQVCLLLLKKEPWRKHQPYSFTTTEILTLHSAYRRFHTKEGKTYFLEAEKQKSKKRR
jgi:hypothetical protein